MKVQRKNTGATPCTCSALHEPGTALKMQNMAEQVTFLGEPPLTAAALAFFDDDRKADGYVWNLPRLWGWRPDVFSAFASLRALLNDDSAVTDRDRAVLVAATASERNDSY